MFVKSRVFGSGLGILENAFHDKFRCDLFAGEQHGGEFAAEDLGSDDDVGLDELDAAEVAGVVDGGDGAGDAVELLDGEDGEGIFAIVGKHGEDGFGAVGAGFAEDVEHTGVADDHVDVFGQAFFGLLADDAGDVAAAAGELAPGVDGKGRVADDDEMLFAMHGSAFAVKDALQVLADERPDDRGERSSEDGHTENNDGDGEHARLEGVRRDVSVADGAHGDHGVVERGGKVGDMGLEALAEVVCAESGIGEEHDHRGDGKESAGGDAGAAEMAVVPDEQEQREGEVAQHGFFMSLNDEESVDEAEGDQQDSHGPCEAGTPEQGEAHDEHAASDEERGEEPRREIELPLCELMDVDLPRAAEFVVEDPPAAEAEEQRERYVRQPIASAQEVVRALEAGANAPDERWNPVWYRGRLHGRSCN